MNKNTLAASAALLAMLPAHAMAESNPDMRALRAEIQAMKNLYERRISELEGKLATMERGRETHEKAPAADASGRTVYGNTFNPSIGAILNGQFRSFSTDSGDIAGFAVGHEGERGKEGFSVNHTELNLSANADDKFFGSVTAALAEHDGETEIELEEAYIQTLPGLGLPQGATVKAGRALWTLGYLNEHHAHADDFADRPLPYRAFLDGTFNDDGVELSYVLPTDFYSEIGGGVFRGADFPFGGADGEAVGAWSAFARVGGDIGENHNWRAGAYVLSGKAKEGRLSNEDMVNFVGDMDLYAADLRYTWAPTGNPREQEVIFQGEYFWRNENGSYEDSAAATGLVNVDDHTSGWYAQGIYKFHPQWRVGLRYSRLAAPSVPLGLAGSTLDSGGYDPEAYAAMVDWTNSEFSRVRLQYNREELSAGQEDNQFLLQYILSLGAHAAHKY
ncbi:MAG: hypothetical protein J0L97_02465 [Alphaproteobacteria bacterium]|nr:hypothetical protein [Alphaproteobacteria bacterium]